MADNGVSGSSSQTLAESVVKHLSAVLETEVHEKTLVTALLMMGRWGAKLSNVPHTLIQTFHKGMGMLTYFRRVCVDGEPHRGITLRGTNPSGVFSIMARCGHTPGKFIQLNPWCVFAFQPWGALVSLVCVLRMVISTPDRLYR